MTTARARLLTANEVAEYLALDLATVRRLTRRKVLPAINIADDAARRPTWRYRQGDLDAWLNQRRSA
jgi:excisionase family DNA binding protein